MLSKKVRGGGRSVAREVLGGGGRPTGSRMNGLPPDDWRGAVAVGALWLSHPGLRSAALLSGCLQFCQSGPLAVKKVHVHVVCKGTGEVKSDRRWCRLGSAFSKGAPIRDPPANP